MNYIKVLNITFLSEKFQVVLEQLKKGKFMVVPSGPGLATIGKDLTYTEAVQNADFAIPDSKYMVFLLKVLKGIHLSKFSGYLFLKHFFSEKIFANELFLIDPNERESKANNTFLNGIGIPINKSYQYIAPIYKKNSIVDDLLIDKLQSLKIKPKYIMINLGSGVQEPLGYYLKQKLNFNVGIICTGAAISFFTGRQANITPLIDKLGMGWLWRCLKNPKVFIPRYLGAFRLFFQIFKSDVEVIE